MWHLERKKNELDSTIKEIDESWKLISFLKSWVRKQKVKTREAITFMLGKRDEEEIRFANEKDLHLENDPVYQKALKSKDTELLQKFKDRTLTIDEYLNELYERTQTLPCWLFCVEKDWKWWVLNKETWEFLIEPKYKEISEYECWIYANVDWKYWFHTESYLFDKENLKYLWKYSGESISSDWAFHFVILDWKYKLFNKKLWKIILEQKYDFASWVDKNFARVEIKWKYWIMDKGWTETVTPKYDAIDWNFDANFAYTLYWDPGDYNKEWKKWWLIDKKTWMVIIEPIYDRIWNFENWVAEVTNEWKRFKINSKWEIVGDETWI